MLKILFTGEEEAHLYTNGNLSSNSRISASLDLIVTGKERITVQLKLCHMHLISTPFPGIMLLLRVLQWVRGIWSALWGEV